MHPPHEATFAVIGGGFSGVMTGAHLAQLGAPRGATTVLVERAAALGRGVAYGTTCDAHVLNVPAGNMSAYAERPLHFVEFARSRPADVSESSFLPRAWYGDYLAQIAGEHMRNFGLRAICAEAVALSPPSPGEPRARIRLADGGEVLARRVVIAGVNFAPARPGGVSDELAAHPRYVADPWRGDWAAEVAPHEGVLLIGSGLTAIDVLLQLCSRGHTGLVQAVSRRGLLPQPHRPPGTQRAAPPPPEVLAAAPRCAELLAGFRAAVERLASEGYDWRDVIAALRPVTPALWHALPLRERARFLRHLRPYWDAHRHRLAPAPAQAVKDLRSAGRFLVYAGRIRAAAVEREGVRLSIAQRGAGEARELWSHWVVNCTGPGCDPAASREPLWTQLVADGLIRVDALRLGLDTAPTGAAVRADGRAADWLYVVGPLRRPAYWECTAVPELRVHARELAERLVAEVCAGPPCPPCVAMPG